MAILKFDRKIVVTDVNTSGIAADIDVQGSVMFDVGYSLTDSLRTALGEVVFHAYPLPFTDLKKQYAKDVLTAIARCEAMHDALDTLLQEKLKEAKEMHEARVAAAHQRNAELVLADLNKEE